MSPTFPTAILAAWVVFSAGLFGRLDARKAALIALIGGWALLPTGDYPPEVLAAGHERSGPTHAVALPAPPWFNKATAIGLGCLVGSVLFDWANLRRLRPRWSDAPAALWLLAPIATAAANGRPVVEGLIQARYLALTWGVPYLLGRASFADAEALRMFARAWVVAGLVTLPMGLVEFVAGPSWYHAVYGGHPYRFDGSDRWVGHRPLGFLEHGNQFGTWAATAAVAAAWLWATGDARAWRAGRLPIPGGVVVAGLVGSAVLWQSHGSILLMGLALAPLVPLGRWGRRGRWAVAVVAATLALAAGAWAARGGIAGLRDQARAVFHGIGKASFTWRFARLAENVPRLVERPMLGWGRADWSGLTPDGTFTDPIALSLFFLVAGMYGGLGLVALAGLLLTPIGAASRSRPRADSPPIVLAAVLLALNVADLALNGGFLLPMLLAAGGINGCLLGREATPPGLQRG